MDEVSPDTVGERRGLGRELGTPARAHARERWGTMKRRGPALRDFVPGYIEAVQRTPIQTAANLPGGGELFETCARAAEPEGEQLELPHFESWAEAADAALAERPPIGRGRKR